MRPLFGATAMQSSNDDIPWNLSRGNNVPTLGTNRTATTLLEEHATPSLSSLVRDEAYAKISGCDSGRGTKSPSSVSDGDLRLDQSTVPPSEASILAAKPFNVGSDQRVSPEQPAKAPITNSAISPSSRRRPQLPQKFLVGATSFSVGNDIVNQTRSLSSSVDQKSANVEIMFTHPVRGQLHLHTASRTAEEDLKETAPTPEGELPKVDALRPSSVSSTGHKRNLDPDGSQEGIVPNKHMRPSPSNDSTVATPSPPICERPEHSGTDTVSAVEEAAPLILQDDASLQFLMDVVRGQINDALSSCPVTQQGSNWTDSNEGLFPEADLSGGSNILLDRLDTTDGPSSSDNAVVPTDVPNNGLDLRETPFDILPDISLFDLERELNVGSQMPDNLTSDTAQGRATIQENAQSSVTNSQPSGLPVISEAQRLLLSSLASMICDILRKRPKFTDDEFARCTSVLFKTVINRARLIRRCGLADREGWKERFETIASAPNLAELTKLLAHLEDTFESMKDELKLGSISANDIQPLFDSVGAAEIVPVCEKVVSISQKMSLRGKKTQRFVDMWIRSLSIITTMHAKTLASESCIVVDAGSASSVAKALKEILLLDVIDEHLKRNIQRIVSIMLKPASARRQPKPISKNHPAVGSREPTGAVYPLEKDNTATLNRMAKTKTEGDVDKSIEHGEAAQSRVIEKNMETLPEVSVNELRQITSDVLELPVQPNESTIAQRIIKSPEVFPRSSSAVQISTEPGKVGRETATSINVSDASTASPTVPKVLHSEKDAVSPSVMTTVGNVIAPVGKALAGEVVRGMGESIPKPVVEKSLRVPRLPPGTANGISKNRGNFASSSRVSSGNVDGKLVHSHRPTSGSLGPVVSGVVVPVRRFDDLAKKSYNPPHSGDQSVRSIYRSGAPSGRSRRKQQVTFGAFTPVSGYDGSVKDIVEIDSKEADNPFKNIHDILDLDVPDEFTKLLELRCLNVSRRMIVSSLGGLLSNIRAMRVARSSGFAQPLGEENRYICSHIEPSIESSKLRR